MSSNYNNYFFNVRKGSTLPYIKYSISQYQLERYDLSEDLFENVAITFSMRSMSTGVYKIANKEAELIVKDQDDYFKLDDCKYELRYCLTKQDTNIADTFVGEFRLDFIKNNEICLSMSFPTANEIIIDIRDSGVKTEIS